MYQKRRSLDIVYVSRRSEHIDRKTQHPRRVPALRSRHEGLSTIYHLVNTHPIPEPRVLRSEF
jgi:hypothetical protein